MEFDQHLIAISPAYRKLVSYARMLERDLGALKAAYGNAVNDQNRAKHQLKCADDILCSLADTISAGVAAVRIAHRDDPGRGGSGR